MRHMIVLILLTGCGRSLMDLKVQAHNGKVLYDALEFCRVPLTEWNGTVEDCHGTFAKENLEEILSRHPEFKVK